MTTNREAKGRIYTLEKKAKELEENGHDKEQCYRMLKVYHNQWFTVSHATQRQTCRPCWIGHTPMTKQTTILTFLPKPIGRPYHRLDA